MKDYKAEILEASMANKILKFGSFTLKSGRESPYFFNAGLFTTGRLLNVLANAYAETILDSGIDADVIFGPAYKGIPLCAITVTRLAQLRPDSLGQIEYAYNRKEKKDHGEGGSLVGASLKGKKVLIIDDVMTAGTAIREAISIIQQEGGILRGIVVAVDRQERTSDSPLSTIQAVQQEYGINATSIINLDDIIQFSKDKISKDELSQLIAYRNVYGASQC